MTETNQDYDLVPVTAKDEWWLMPPSEVRLHGQDVLAIVAAPYRAGRYHVMCTDSADDPHIVTLDVNGFGITRRVPRQREGWRYAKLPLGSNRFDFYRFDGSKLEVRWMKEEWEESGKFETFDQVLDFNGIETDEHGNLLTAPPTRTPLTAESFPMWAVWVRAKARPEICRSIRTVSPEDVMIGPNHVSYSQLAEHYQIAGTNGVWVDATVEGVRDGK